MKQKLSKSAKKTRSSLSIQTYKHPRLFVILAMVLLNIILVLVAAFIAMVIDSDYTHYIDALVNGAVKWLLTPNAVLDIEKPATLVLAVIVLVIGMVLFTGTIIGLATNAIKDYFQKKDSNAGTLRLHQHIVILNWNSKVPELVADLVHVEGKAINVIVLGDVDKTYAEKQILQAVKYKHEKISDLVYLNIFVKQGDPLLKDNLLSISITEASAVMIMSQDTHTLYSDDLKYRDLNIIRILLALSHITFSNPTTFVTEVKNIETKAKIFDLASLITSLQPHHIIPVCFDRRLGQIMAQSVLYPSIESVYLSLFSFDGSEAYVLNNQSIEDILEHHPYAIPLGAEANTVYVLSPSNQTKSIRHRHPYEPIPIKAKEFRLTPPKQVFILGDNHKKKYILEAFKAYENLYCREIHVEFVSIDALFDLVHKINIEPSPSTIVLLSDESAHQDILDANVIDALIYLETHLKERQHHILVELLDPRNAVLIKDFDMQNTIISNKIISLLLSKLAMYPETASFYEHLLTIDPSEAGKDDFAILLENASASFSDSFPLRFESMKQFGTSAYLAKKNKALPIGLIHNGKMALFEGDLHAKTDLKIVSDDQIIWMKL